MKGHIFLVNPSHPLPEGYEPPSLSPALPGSEILLESECASALTALLGRIDAWDKIIPVSGYRPHNEQQTLWDETMRDYGETFTRKYVAVPGCSEHETGLAIDLAFNTGGGIDFIRPYFPYEGVCGEFRALAAEFGFIERYPAGKEHITRISAEPWHFRYVGAVHATYMASHGLTLEEYMEMLCSGHGKPFGETAFVSHNEFLPRGVSSVEDSNAGGLIITFRRTSE